MLLDFLWHLRGSTKLVGTTGSGEVLDRVERLLHKQQKLVTSRTSDSVTFDEHRPFYFQVNSWLAMAIYDNGRFWLEEQAGCRLLKYDLSSLPGFVLCAFFAALCFVFATIDGGVSGGIKYAVIAFGWLYGVNMLLAWVRIPRAINKAIVGI